MLASGLRGQVETHMFWYLGRSGGLVAYLVVFISVALGLVVSSRKAGSAVAPGWFYEGHKFLSIFALAVMLFHVLVMLPDPYAHFTLAELFIPFRSHIDPVALAVGVFAMYAAVLVVISFYAKGIIRQKGWRAIHWLSFAIFALATTHGFLAGSDARTSLVTTLYVFCSSVIVLLAVARFRLARRGSKIPARRPMTTS